MKSRYWIILGLTAALIALFAIPIYFYNTPLGPPLELEGAPEAAAAAESAIEPAAAQPAKIVAPIKQDDPPNQCGGEGRVNILFLGQDLPETPQRGADAIRLMFINYDKPSVGIISMPPDLLAYPPILPDEPVTDATTLTYTFWEEKQPPPVGEPAAARKATAVVAQSLWDSYTFYADKYMTLNQPVFGQCVDDLGGVQVDVEYFAVNTFSTLEDPRPDFDPTDNQPPDDTQLMDGQRALDYIRILEPSPVAAPEWARFQRQNAVVAGIYDAVLDPANILNMPSAIGDFYSLLVTDLKPKELRSLYCMLTEEEVELRYEDVPTTMVEVLPGGALAPDTLQDIQDLITELEDWSNGTEE